jgi:hypothetical protein
MKDIHRPVTLAWHGITIALGRPRVTYTPPRAGSG